MQIGYYHLSNPNACPACLKKTDFEPFAQIYEGAWPRIEKAIQDAGRWGLGILIDLHGVAGNQNDDGKYFMQGVHDVVGSPLLDCFQLIREHRRGKHSSGIPGRTWSPLRWHSAFSLSIWLVSRMLSACN